MSIVLNQFSKSEKSFFHIKDRKITIRPIKTIIEAIKKLPPPKSTKECKSFCGVVNYLSIFCPNLQKLLKPTYKLTRKGIAFRWYKEYNEALLKIKSLLIKPPILHLPICGGRFILYQILADHTMEAVSDKDNWET